MPFNNIWGLRNFSRARALKKAVQDFIRAEDDQKLILAYCTHTPFIEAAIYAKKKDPRIKVCLYVPDLPNYMNLSANRSWLYDVAKVYDVAVMTRLMKQVDSFVLLTEQMKDALPVGEQEKTMKQFIEETQTQNPKEMAHYLLGKVLETSGELPTDDMTILVIGIWKY